MRAAKFGPRRINALDTPEDLCLERAVAAARFQRARREMTDAARSRRTCARLLPSFCYERVVALVAKRVGINHQKAPMESTASWPGSPASAAVHDLGVHREYLGRGIGRCARILLTLALAAAASRHFTGREPEDRRPRVVPERVKPTR